MVRIVSGSAQGVDELAAAWAVRSAERALTPQEQQQLDDWLSQSSRHVGAFVRAQAIWTDVDRVVALDDTTRADPVAPESASRWRRYAIAASLILAILVGGITYDRFVGRIATARAEVREIALDDGSRAVLNGGAVVQVRYDENSRQIVLRRGEALFDVAHDTSRPFVVTADDVTVRAVGTRFAVAVEGGDIEVTVAEGTVEVAKAGEPPRLIRANQQFVVAPTGPRRASLDEAEIGRRLAWERGLLVFSGQSLERAASEVSRYSPVPVVIDDPTLARAEFVGVFRIGDGRAFATAAAQAFNGAVVERDGGLHLMRRPSSPSH
ncbi:FecR domain-containing protein [Sphingosinicella sp. CPCC 101087]|uniref:FecR family protein n=1 Tax=Sphingosinicella sp. CPCC 101087 TaxID=2497754 RepID=UPI00101D484D|nr:FecR domain-containing protein [Sphingosinicella sp. CPCC 101087]